MSHPQSTYRPDGSRPRLRPLRDFLADNGVDAIDYLLEILDGESAMPAPFIVNGNVYIESDSESRWRNRLISSGILRLAEVTRAGGHRHGRR